MVRYRPDNLDDITAATKFSKDEIRWVYRAFKQECPSGAINELTFKNIYAKFFPLGGQCSDSEKLYCNMIQLVTLLQHDSAGNRQTIYASSMGSFMTNPVPYFSIR